MVDVLSSGEARERRRPRGVVAVAVALALVAVGQAVTVLRPRELPSGASVSALPNGYSYSTEGDRAQLGFQLRNDGDLTVRVLSVRAAVPGLELVDVVASGEPFRFAAVGAGDAELPAFALEPGTVIELNLVYRLRRCGDVPRDARDVVVRAGAGGARGPLAVPLPGQPSDAVDAGPDDEDPWQQVLVRDLCR